jgi:hypothetical protein
MKAPSASTYRMGMPVPNIMAAVKISIMLVTRTDSWYSGRANAVSYAGCKYEAAAAEEEA